MFDLFWSENATKQTTWQNVSLNHISLVSVMHFFIFHEGVGGRDLILTRLLFFCHMKGIVSSDGEFSRHNLPFEVISVD